MGLACLAAGAGPGQDLKLHFECGACTPHTHNLSLSGTKAILNPLHGSTVTTASFHRAADKLSNGWINHLMLSQAGLWPICIFQECHTRMWHTYDGFLQRVLYIRVWFLDLRDWIMPIGCLHASAWRPILGRPTWVLWAQDCPLNGDENVRAVRPHSTEPIE